MKMVVIGGVKYPCQLTLGAMKEFKTATGKEVDVIDKVPDAEKTDLVMALAYGCVKSASRREGVSLPFSDYEEMMDYVTPGEMADLVTAILVTTGDQEKPKASKKK